MKPAKNGKNLEAAVGSFLLSSFYPGFTFLSFRFRLGACDALSFSRYLDIVGLACFCLLLLLLLHQIDLSSMKCSLLISLYLGKGKAAPGFDILFLIHFWKTLLLPTDYECNNDSAYMFPAPVLLTECVIQRCDEDNDDVK